MSLSIGYTLCFESVVPTEIYQQNNSQCYILFNKNTILDISSAKECIHNEKNTLYWKSAKLSIEKRNIKLGEKVVYTGYEKIDAIMLCNKHAVLYKDDFKVLEGVDLDSFESAFSITFPNTVGKDSLLLYFIAEHRRLITYINESKLLCVLGVHKLGKVFPLASRQLDTDCRIHSIYVLDNYVILKAKEKTLAFDPFSELSEIYIEGNFNNYYETKGSSIYRTGIKYHHPESFQEEWLESLKLHDMKEALVYAKDKIRLLRECDDRQIEKSMSKENVPVIAYAALYRSRMSSRILEKVIQIHLDDRNWFEIMRMEWDGLTEPLQLNDPKSTSLWNSRNRQVIYMPASFA